MSQRPRVERMVMFKHGVAYLERQGPAEGEFELSFRRDEMNDVLKSLAVWVARGDAKVGAIAFEAPNDPDDALAARRLLLQPGDALGGLVRALRGRSIAVDDGHRVHRGEVIGIEETPGGDGAPRRALLLRAQAGAVSIVDLATVRAIEMLEQPSREDLDFLIDRGRAATAGENRIVHVSIAGRAEDLRVAYVIPAPAWRVSYRLVRDGNETLLMATGIVHNPVDEELSEVELTLTTGQPVSFVIDLYTPKRVQRTVVEEQSRAASAPTAFERARAARSAFAAAPSAGPEATLARIGAGPITLQTMGTDDSPTTMGASIFAQAEDAAKGEDRGEFFEYRVASRVSLKRGGSAMVPLVAAKLDARKELIWRDGKDPHPDLVIRFENSSDLVLEEGPAVIYDGGAYAGESMVPFTPRGAEVKLAFAKDLAVRCRKSSTHASVVTALRLSDAYVTEEQRREEHHTISAENDHGEEVEIVFELPRDPERKIHAEAPYVAPFEQTASYNRFRARIPARGKVELKVREDWIHARYIRYENLSVEQLESWLGDKRLDQGSFAELSGVLLAWQTASELDARKARIEAELEQLHGKQSQITQQLGVLKESGPEGALRARYARELEAAQDRINACEAEIQSLIEAADKARATAALELSKITGMPRS